MINIELTARVVGGNITFPYQNEIENLALETIGSSEDIYFEKIPITKNLYVEFCQIENFWILKSYQKGIDLLDRKFLNLKIGSKKGVII